MRELHGIHVLGDGRGVFLNAVRRSYLDELVQVPQQDNDWDCGVFLLHYAFLLLTEPPQPSSFFSHALFDSHQWFNARTIVAKRVQLKELIVKMKCTINADFETAVNPCSAVESDASFADRSDSDMRSASADRMSSLEQRVDSIGDDRPKASELQVDENGEGGTRHDLRDELTADAVGGGTRLTPSAADAAEAAIPMAVRSTEGTEGEDAEAEADSSDLSLSPTRSPTQPVLGSAHTDDGNANANLVVGDGKRELRCFPHAAFTVA